ncbi:MAG: hypothetical protein JRI72_17770 [Deltaproteobacteria bacterium]|nr:hypothetical protein [Deltaproteobacteria bacterium]
MFKVTTIERNNRYSGPPSVLTKQFADINAANEYLTGCRLADLYYNSGYSYIHTEKGNHHGN